MSKEGTVAVQHDPAHILGIEGEITLDAINRAYREARTRVESKVASSDIAATQSLAQIDWAYQELLTQFEARSAEDDESIVSAALLPGLTEQAASLLGVTENVVYINRKPAAEEFEPVHPMDLPEFSSINSSPSFSTPRLPLSTPDVQRTTRSHAFDSKQIVPIRASHQTDAQTRLGNVIQSSEQISGSLLKKLREELNVSLEEINVRTKIPRKYILAIEADDYSNLPAVVYFRGFISSYLRYLGLTDRNDIVDSLTENYRARMRHKSRVKPVS